MPTQRPYDLLAAHAIAGAAARPGDSDRTKPQALSKLRPRVNGYLRHAIQDPVEREQCIWDVMSEALFLALEPNAAEEALWPQVHRILRRVARERWRQSREVHGGRVADHFVADHSIESQRAYRMALWEWESKALAHLTSLQRGALELHVMDKLSDSEIAKQLGCPQGSVRVLRATAKKRLRDLIAREAIPPPPVNDTH